MLPATFEWLTDNGSCHVAHETRGYAQDIGLAPLTTPVERPQSNGMAEAFVRTFKRDYVAVNLSPIRLAYVEIPLDEMRWSTTGFPIWALRWLKERGVRVERVMADYVDGSIGRPLRKVLRMFDIRYICTRPYTPKTNSKPGRLIHTLPRKWAYAIQFHSPYLTDAPSICPDGRLAQP